MPPAGDVFGLDGIFLTKSNPVVVSTIGINSTAAGAGITITSAAFTAATGIATLTLSTAAGLSTTPFYIGAKIAVSGLSVSGVAHTGYNGTFNVTGFAGTTTVSYATTGYVGPVIASISGQTGTVMLVSDTQVTNTTWSSAQTHGWFAGGGANVSTVSKVERIDFSNDTATANIRGTLSLGRNKTAATGNASYSWFGGGNTSSLTSRVDRIDFSNDSGTASIRGPLSSTKYSLAATGNSNYGWFGGGLFSPSPTSITATVERIDLSNDSGTATPRGLLSSTRTRAVATGNSNYGWFVGGSSTPPSISTVDRIDFSNDSATASIRGPLSSARYELAATGNSNYGWFGGGAPGPVATVDRIDFSNDLATATVRGLLSSARYNLAATGNTNYGWFGGGQIAFGQPLRSTVDLIDFSNDSVQASVRGALSAAGYRAAATSGQARSSSIRLQKAGNYGWFGGGFPGPVATVDRIDFSNDSVAASPRGSLSLARNSLAATGNSNYGWFGGGYTSTPTPVVLSTVNRIDFSNDSPTTSVRGPLSLARQRLSATGNSNYGWFGGGLITPGSALVATVDRIDFSNDLATASPRGPLSLARQRLSATGNSNYGWFGGGYTSTPVETVDRIDFSNDLATTSLRGPISQARLFLAATGNSNYGWFGGGRGGSPIATVATVDRINFSNDTATATARGPLSSARFNLTATGNSNYGWFGGGFPAVATVDRIDFSNDSVAASPRGPLSAARGYLAATSNTPT